MDIIKTIDNYNLNILNIYPETVCDGEGIRYSIYLAGCRHACVGCHNPESWNPQAGRLLTSTWLVKIIDEVLANPILSGITISGGDPFYNPEALCALLQILKIKTNQNIWCYSGYTYEAINADPVKQQCLKYIDVLVDGPYIAQFRNLDLPFRGSTNQNIIYLKK